VSSLLGTESPHFHVNKWPHELPHKGGIGSSAPQLPEPANLCEIHCTQHRMPKPAHLCKLNCTQHRLPKPANLCEPTCTLPQVHSLVGLGKLLHPKGSCHGLLAAAAQAQTLQSYTLHTAITHNQVGRDGQERLPYKRAEECMRD